MNYELCLEIKRQRMSDWLKPDQITKIIIQQESEQEGIGIRNAQYPELEEILPDQNTMTISYSII